jgi:hypothetical protein
MKFELKSLPSTGGYQLLVFLLNNEIEIHPARRVESRRCRLRRSRSSSLRGRRTSARALTFWLGAGGRLLERGRFDPVTREGRDAFIEQRPKRLSVWQLG